MLSLDTSGAGVLEACGRASASDHSHSSPSSSGSEGDERIGPRDTGLGDLEAYAEMRRDHNEALEAKTHHEANLMALQQHSAINAHQQKRELAAAEAREMQAQATIRDLKAKVMELEETERRAHEQIRQHSEELMKVKASYATELHEMVRDRDLARENENELRASMEYMRERFDTERSEMELQLQEKALAQDRECEALRCKAKQAEDSWHTQRKNLEEEIRFQKEMATKLKQDFQSRVADMERELDISKQKLLSSEARVEAAQQEIQHLHDEQDDETAKIKRLEEDHKWMEAQQLVYNEEMQVLQHEQMEKSRIITELRTRADEAEVFRARSEQFRLKLEEMKQRCTTEFDSLGRRMRGDCESAKEKAEALAKEVKSLKADKQKLKKKLQSQAGKYEVRLQHAEQLCKNCAPPAWQPPYQPPPPPAAARDYSSAAGLELNVPPDPTVAMLQKANMTRCAEVMALISNTPMASLGLDYP